METRRWRRGIFYRDALRSLIDEIQHNGEIQSKDLKYNDKKIMDQN